MKVASRWTREMAKDCWAALRGLFEVSGHEFQVKPVSGIVCFSLYGHLPRWGCRLGEGLD